MNLNTVNLKPPIPSQNPGFILSRPVSSPCRPHLLSGGGGGLAVCSSFKRCPLRCASFLCSASGTGRSRVNNGCSRPAVVKDIDVTTLGNLCVDIVLAVPELPPLAVEDRMTYMERLSSCPPDKQFWEAGGNCNTAIAAARLGLNCAAVGHVGDEIYGHFLLNVLKNEGIGMVSMVDDTDSGSPNVSYETLLCWVLVDPLQRHGFCSRADFSEEPAFNFVTELSGEVKTAITRSKILFCNGYGFDDLSPALIMAAIDYAVEVGTSIFFDPGPRGKSLSRGSPLERQALDKFLQKSDVLLLTSDEAESLTNINDPVLAGQALLNQGEHVKWVVVKMGARGSFIITRSSVSCAPAFKVNVVDTVGCGDSFVSAVAFGFIHGLPLASTLAIANAVGAATATGSGAGRNVATLDQALEIMKSANLHEDDMFWSSLFNGKYDSCDITLLSDRAVNGSSRGSSHVSLQKLIPELLPKFEPSRMKDHVHS